MVVGIMVSDACCCWCDDVTDGGGARGVDVMVDVFIVWEKREESKVCSAIAVVVVVIVCGDLWA